MLHSMNAKYFSIESIFLFYFPHPILGGCAVLCKLTLQVVDSGLLCRIQSFTALTLVRRVEYKHPPSTLVRRIDYRFTASTPVRCADCIFTASTPVRRIVYMFAASTPVRRIDYTFTASTPVGCADYTIAASTPIRCVDSGPSRRIQASAASTPVCRVEYISAYRGLAQT
jgi:hypothetical protein